MEVIDVSDNWVVQNLENALNTWNEKLAEIWQIITQSPEQFKGGTIWDVIVGIHGAVQAIGLALLVLFFVVGVMRTCGNFAEIKRPEQALKLFIRFALAKGAVTYGLELMMALFNIVQGLTSTIMNAAGFGSATDTVLPQEIVTAVEDCGFFESIPLWAVTLIGGLFITVLSFIMIMSVYGRFFKLYLYTAIAPVPLSAFAGEPSQSVGKSFIKSYSAVCLEGAIIVLACIIFSLFAAAPPVVNPDAAAVTMVWSYVGELIFNADHKGTCKVYPAPFAVFLNQDDKTYVEPDISVICDNGKLDDRGCNGAPDWVIEIVSQSSQRMDYLTKLFKYCTAGVREYWIVNPMKRTVLVYLFGENEDSTQYLFEDEIPVGIYPDFTMRISEFV